MFVVDLVVVAAAAVVCAFLFILVASLCFLPLSQVRVVRSKNGVATE